MNFPEIVDMALPAEGVFHNLVFVSIRKQYPYQAYKIMHGLWGMGQMMFSKYIVVVDEDCDVHNTSEVLFRLCANTDPERDSTIIRNPSDSLDHAPSVAEHRLAHGLRRHAQTARRKLPPRLAGAAQDDRRSAGAGRCAAKESGLIRLTPNQPANLQAILEAVRLRPAEDAARRRIAHERAVRNSAHIDQSMWGGYGLRQDPGCPSAGRTDNRCPGVRRNNRADLPRSKRR